MGGWVDADLCFVLWWLFLVGGLVVFANWYDLSVLQGEKLNVG